MTLILQGTDNSVSSPAVQGGTAGTTTGVYYPASNQVALATNGTLALIVDSSQRVGLGVTPNSWDSTIKNPLQFVTGSIYAYRPNSLQNDFGLASSAYYDGSWRYSYSSNAANAYYMTSEATAGNYRHVFRVAPSGTAGNVITWTDALAIQDAGGIRAVNTIAVGNATPASTGAGITFPATQSGSSNANTLDDYEEGTFTPTITASSGGAPGSIAGAQIGSYTKVGRLVYVTCQVVNFSKGTLSGTLSVSGLPFAIANSANASGVCRWELPSPSAGTTVIIPQAGDGLTAVDLQQFDADGFNGGYTASSLSASTSNSIYNMVYTYLTS